MNWKYVLGSSIATAIKSAINSLNDGVFVAGESLTLSAFSASGEFGAHLKLPLKVPNK